MIAGVVLAGGEGRRFGGDKLAALVEDKASITRVAEALRGAGAAVVYASTVSGDRCRLYTGLAGLDGCVYDPPLPCRGPGAAVAAALGLLEAYTTVVVAPGDAPWLSVAAVSRLLGLAGSPAATVLHGDGFLESLLIVLRRGAAEPRDLEALCRLRGELRPTDALRASPWYWLVGSGLLSEAASSYAHVNTRENARMRGAKSPLGRAVHRLPGALHGAAGLGREELCERLRSEHRVYREAGLRQLERQARRDLELIGCGQ